MMSARSRAPVPRFRALLHHTLEPAQGLNLHRPRGGLRGHRDLLAGDPECSNGTRVRGQPAARARPDGPEGVRVAKLASDDTDRVERDIRRHVEEQFHDAVGDLYRRLAEAVERVSERLNEDENGKPLVFRDTMISNIRDLVDVVPRLNIFGDDKLAVVTATLAHCDAVGRGRPSHHWQMASQLVTHGLLRDAAFTLPPDAEPGRT